jgi:hypothetical protein
VNAPVYPDCPECGHNTSAFAWRCTAFVVDVDGATGRWANYCGCDCYAAINGESISDVIARGFNDKENDHGH